MARPRLHFMQRGKNALLTVYHFSGTAVAFGVSGSYVTLLKIFTPIVRRPHARRHMSPLRYATVLKASLLISYD